MSPAPFKAATARLDEGVDLVTVRGELDLGTAADLEGPLERAIGGSGRILVDLSECEFIDSTGIAMIVRAWQRVCADGNAGQLVLCSANPQVSRVLQITGLEASIPIYPDRDAALQALRTPAEPA